VRQIVLVGGRIGQERTNRETGVAMDCNQGMCAGLEGSWTGDRQKASELWTSSMWGLRKGPVLGWNPCFWLGTINPYRASRFLDKERKNLSVGHASINCPWNMHVELAVSCGTCLSVPQERADWEFKSQESITYKGATEYSILNGPIVVKSHFPF